MPAAKTTTKRTTTKKATPKAKETSPLQAPYFDALGERNGEFELPQVIFAENPN